MLFINIGNYFARTVFWPSARLRFTPPTPTAGRYENQRLGESKTENQKADCRLCGSIYVAAETCAGI